MTFSFAEAGYLISFLGVCSGFSWFVFYYIIIIVEMGKKIISEERKMFFQTLQDIRKLVGEHRGDYSKDTMGLKKSNTKMPFTHLQGRR